MKVCTKFSSGILIFICCN